jgi:sec-independent protein translocase protein TatA
MLDFSSPMHLILIILVIVLLFGGKKIPELMKGIGQGMKEFKKASALNDEPEEEKKSEVKTSEVKVPDRK